MLSHCTEQNFQCVHNYTILIFLVMFISKLLCISELKGNSTLKNISPKINIYDK